MRGYQAFPELTQAIADKLQAGPIRGARARAAGCRLRLHRAVKAARQVEGRAGARAVSRCL